MNAQTFISSYHLLSVGAIVPIIALAHGLVPAAYNWKNHTISHLAAQQYRYGWLMRTGCLLFGGILSAGILLKLEAGYGSLFPEVLLLLYGLTIACSGIFSTRPFDGEPNYSPREVKIHSWFSHTAGFAFSSGILAFVVNTPNGRDRWVHFFFLVFIATCAFFFKTREKNTGLIQRLMFAGGYAWMVFFYNQQ